MHRLWIYYPVIFQLMAVACLGCIEPYPFYLREIDETDGAGTVVLTMNESPTSTPSTWTFSVSFPTTNATYLETLFKVVQNSSDPFQWLIVLVKPLDIERIQVEANFILADLTLDVQCSKTDTTSVLRYERTVVIRAISEFTPVFTDFLPPFNVTEVSEVGTKVASLMEYVNDQDIQNNGEESDIRRFTTQTFTGNGLLSGAGVFGVTSDGDVLVLNPLDYETGKSSFGLNVTVEDTDGLKSWSLIRIDVRNNNDNPPTFVYKSPKGGLKPVTEYRATVEENYTGPITLEPGPIQTHDPDNDVISYYIKTGYPDDYRSYINLDVSMATVTLTQSVNESNINHFTLIIEARDFAAHSTRIGESSTEGHVTTASLLLFISGRDATSGSPGTPRTGSSSTSTIASVNTDALFISVIALSTLSLLLIISVIVLCCKLKKKNRRNDRFIHSAAAAERCNTLKDKKPSDWSIQMRPVERGNSEKAFIRSLSRSTPYTNEGFVDDKTNDDVFVTGITPYTHRAHTESNQRNDNNNITNSNNNNNNIKSHIVDQGIVPYNEEGVDASVAAIHSATTLPRNISMNPPEVVFVATTTTTTSANLVAGNNKSTKPAAKGVSNGFESLDLRTSVTPMVNDDTRPIRIAHNSNNDNNNNKNNNNTPSNNGTSRSLTSADVMNELDQIIFNENQFSSDRGERITHFTNESTTDHNTSINSHRHHTSGEADEGITSFSRDSIDFCVMPFEPISSPGGPKTFLFPGDENSPAAHTSLFKNDPVLNSADVYYRQNNGQHNKK